MVGTAGATQIETNFVTAVISSADTATEAVYPEVDFSATNDAFQREADVTTRVQFGCHSSQKTNGDSREMAVIESGKQSGQRWGKAFPFRTITMANLFWNDLGGCGPPQLWTHDEVLHHLLVVFYNFL